MHINRTLPPVGISVKILVNNAWISVIRESWITNKDLSIDFKVIHDSSVITQNRGNIQWIYL